MSHKVDVPGAEIAPGFDIKPGIGGGSTVTLKGAVVLEQTTLFNSLIVSLLKYVVISNGVVGVKVVEVSPLILLYVILSGEDCHW